MRVRSWLGCLAVGLLPGYVQAADVANFTMQKTADLYRVCSAPSDDPLYREAINFCQGFLLGAVSYHDAVTDRQNLQRLICYPATVTRDDGIRAFVEWAASHQGDQKFMGDPPVIGAVRALAQKWPCKQTSERSAP